MSMANVKNSATEIGLIFIRKTKSWNFESNVFYQPLFSPRCAFSLRKRCKHIYSHDSAIEKWYLDASARCKQLSEESFLCALRIGSVVPGVRYPYG